MYKINKKSKKKISLNEVKTIENEFGEELVTNPKFSLQVNPEGLYNFTEQEIEFIQNMVQYKNVKFVSEVLLKIPLEEGLKLYKQYNVQEEIKRINLSLYARRFYTKMADLDQLGGYLTTALTDENVVVADRLDAKDKLKAAQLLIELNKLKMDIIENPDVIDVSEVETDIRNLSVKQIENLIENSEEIDKTIEKKTELINFIDKDNLLTSEEIVYLKSLSINELEKLVKEIKGGIKKYENENK